MNIENSQQRIGYKLFMQVSPLQVSKFEYACRLRLNITAAIDMSSSKEALQNSLTHYTRLYWHWDALTFAWVGISYCLVHVELTKNGNTSRASSKSYHTPLPIKPKSTLYRENTPNTYHLLVTEYNRPRSIRNARYIKSNKMSVVNYVYFCYSHRTGPQSVSWHTGENWKPSCYFMRFWAINTSEQPVIFRGNHRANYVP